MDELTRWMVRARAAESRERGMQKAIEQTLTAIETGDVYEMLNCQHILRRAVKRPSNSTPTRR